MNFYGGHYTVGAKKFNCKLLAAIEATQTNQPLIWEYHKDIFIKIKPHGLDLPTLYKQRALLLREKYDYLILNYSGGSDSWNILNTFLKNNIKLDHIFVKWPMRFVDKGLYTPNTVDRTAFNFPSEWDFVLKKDLEWISKEHPEIKIEIEDWTDNLNESYFNDTLIQNSTYHTFMTNFLRVPFGSKTEVELVERGLKVASIYGVDKPNIIEIKNKCYFFFQDTDTGTCPVRPENPNGTVYFYSGVDFPQLAVEQAYAVYQHFKNNPQHRHFICPRIKNPIYVLNKFNINRSKNYEDLTDLVRHVIYPDWDFKKFQAYKPVPIPEFYGKQKDIWFETIPEVNNIKQVWKHYWKSYVDLIDTKYKRINQELCTNRSFYYYLGEFDNI